MSNKEIHYKYKQLIYSHPKELFYLFLTEMWERFSYYGIRVILVLYMTQELLISNYQSFLVYGVFTSLVYLTPIIGGYCSDQTRMRVLAIKNGGIIIILGHLLLACSGISDFKNFLFYSGLSIVAIGTGFFKPNIPIIVSNLYKNDVKRDSAFTIFILGINIGALGASLSIPVIAHYLGWHFGFGSAAIGMSIGLIIFIKFNKKNTKDNIICPTKLNSNFQKKMKFYQLTYCVILILLPIEILCFKIPFIVPLFIVCVMIIIFGIMFGRFICTEGIRKNNLMVLKKISFISLSCIVFYVFFEQAGSSVILFTETYINRNILGLEIPSGVFKGLNPLFLFVLAPIFSKVWIKVRWMSKLNITTKFSIAILFLGISFLLLFLGASITDNNYKISMLWIIIFYFFYSIGDLFFTPIALSSITKNSPEESSSLIMGCFYFNIAIANYISGFIATYTTKSNGYYSTFKSITICCFIITIIGLMTNCINRIIKRKKTI